MEKIVDHGYTAYLSDIKPGDVVASKDDFQSDEVVQEVRGLCDEAISNVNSVIDEASNDVNAEMAEAPTQEAVNYISTLRNRSKTSQNEIDAALKKYGDNWASYKAISDIAKGQRESGNSVYCRYSHSLDGADKFLERAQERCINFIRGIMFERKYNDTRNRQSRLEWCIMDLNSYVDGSFLSFDLSTEDNQA